MGANSCAAPRFLSFTARLLTRAFLAAAPRALGLVATVPTAHIRQHTRTHHYRNQEEEGIVGPRQGRRRAPCACATLTAVASSLPPTSSATLPTCIPFVSASTLSQNSQPHHVHKGATRASTVRTHTQTPHPGITCRRSTFPPDGLF